MAEAAVASPAAAGGFTERIEDKARIRSIDILRGMVIVLMALDHVRDYFSYEMQLFDALDLERTYPALYATRWVTHFCAPVFVFLAGVSAFLQGQRKTKAELSRFLLLRGLWLILLEFTLLSFGWSFETGFLFLQVIWAIGVSMIALAALVWLPWQAVLAVGVAIVAGHNLLDPMTPQQFGGLALLWTALHEGGLLGGRPPEGLLAYPVLPWIGVIAAGYGAGRAFTLQDRARRRVLLRAGAGLVALFLLLRLTDAYGDPNAWEAQRNWARTLMDVLDTTKYPPSLVFVCMTIGPALLLLPLLERMRGAAAEPWVTFGSVPFFFYVLHIYLIHGSARVLATANGYESTGLATAFGSPETLQGWGYSLPVVYLIWILLVAALYLPCRWFAGVKRRRREWWLSYL
ncbi:MAG TPA: heparan-alpha-glucosaminide N-acetyltransferase domain-containing protein [Caulobacteraceae bacterium]|jgi:uncharacterized membrane protein